jgi:RHS repeat-associated protein
VWVTTERSTHDIHGRVLDSFDALDRRTRATYTPATGGPLTQRTETNSAGHTEIQTLEPAWGLPTATVDPNGQRADLTYDGVGRLTAVWLPGRDKGTQSESLRFAYEVRNSAPTAITTERLLPDGASYVTSTILYDGMLRERQSQTQTHGGGRLIIDTHYNTRGLVAWRSEDFYDTSNVPPSTTLVGAGDVPQIPGITEFVYDGVERVVDEIFLDRGQEAWRTSYTYGGDRTHTAPPAGGTAATEIKDARDRQVALRQYHGPTPSGTYDETIYTYTSRGELAAVTDPVGNTWEYTYDQRGRRITAADPDQGVTTTTYDAAGQELTIADARGMTVGYTYDALGRTTSLRDGSSTGPKRAEWVFDTLPNGIGKLTRSIRYHDGQQYVNQVRGYNNHGLPTGHTVIVPAGESGLAGSYETLIGYKPDGSVETTTLPGAGDLAAEELVVGYDDVGAATWLVSALAVYVGTVHYSTLGDLTQRRLGEFGKRTTISYSYDDATRRLTTSSAMIETSSGPVEVLDLAYSYHDAGGLTRIADSPGSGTPNDTQCFRYDYLQRMTDAWTPLSTVAENCQADPGPLGGAAPYRFTWTYDQTGNRLTQRRFGPGGGATTYSHPQSGSPHPHAVTQASTSSPTGTQVNTYAYDDTGNLIERNRQGQTQTLTWNAEGKVESIEDAQGTTEFVYDADGNRLIRRDPAGKTLYLDGTELRYDETSGEQTCTRYYQHLGTTVAVRTAAGLTWLVNDHHGTGEVAIRASDMQVQRRRTTPFGEFRGQPPAWWPGDKGFVGGTEDPAGYTHLGARLYDNTLGRFISVDPLIDYFSPQQMHGYAYGNNAPPTFSDPDGEWWNPIKAAKDVATNAVNSVNKAAGAARRWVQDNHQLLDAISTGLGIAAIAVSPFPPLNAATPILAGASFGVGLAATYGACSSGDAVGCGTGALGLIPGVKSVKLGYQAVKAAHKTAKHAARRHANKVARERRDSLRSDATREQVNAARLRFLRTHDITAEITAYTARMRSAYRLIDTFQAQRRFNWRTSRLDGIDIVHKNVTTTNWLTGDSPQHSSGASPSGSSSSAKWHSGSSSGSSSSSSSSSSVSGGGGGRGLWKFF